MLSWVFGEGEKISQVSLTMEKALGEYNTNFKNLGKHEQKLDYNINSLTRNMENITSYEKCFV